MHLIDYSIVVLYLSFILLLGFILEKKASKSLDDYFLGNRQLPWWVLGASGMASNTDIAGTMVIAALVYALGTQGFFIEIRGGIVLIMAFLMVFMGKWNRRSHAMTLAEWMQFRFGKGKEGNTARIISAVANIIFSIGAMSYFSIGGGKFLGGLMGIEDRIASIILVSFACLYTVLSGFYGVVWTDVFQGGLVFIAILYIIILAWQTVTLPDDFSVSIPSSEGFIVKDWNFADWSNLFPPLQADLPGNYAIFNLFGGVMFFYMVKTIIDGCSGGGGYMAQRYFAAKSDKDAGLLSLFWIVLMSFRWPLVAAFAILGIHYGLTQDVPIADPELILPTVIATYIPIGIKGLLVACFIAAAMSTFDSIINSSAAYWSKDIYQAYLVPNASDEQLILQSRLASVLIVVIGLLFSFNLSNINEIWGWLSLGLGVGLAIPLLLRWYWWRFNGYGFAMGTLAGMIAAIVTKAVILPNLTDPQWQEYTLFLVPATCSFLGCIVGTLLTPPTDRKVTEEFYQVTKPFGFWGDIGEGLKPSIKARIKQENTRDIMATFIAVPWQLSLFLFEMMIMMKNWQNVKLLGLILLLLSIGLYFTWFRYLKNSPHSLSFRDLTQTVIKKLNPLTEEKNIKIELITDKYSPFPIQGDRNLLEQNLTNLLSNGIEVTDQGIMSIQLSSDTDHIYLTIENTEASIPTNVQNVAFEKFTS
ncbi:MAG: sodium:solute symporter [Microcystaceae cyanobacterium]